MTLSTKIAVSINIQSKKKFCNLAFLKPNRIDVWPKPKLHPHIIEACEAIYGKLPDEMAEEEHAHFERYNQGKMNNGQPIEESLQFKPD